MRRIEPILLLLFSLLLFLVELVLPAGACFLIGYVMIIELIWPEKWGAEGEEQKSKND